ncbi:MAG TPA: VWA domain-containing protein [Vicinamibacterales bacterium]|nr:VWA domain-containing protein [Vicinamibacterales bacterium]
MKKVVTVPALIVVAIVSTQARDTVPPLQSIQEAAPTRSAQATRPTFRTISSVVALNVTVTDGKKLVTGLTQDDFQVYEDGVQQEVRFFESRAVPIDLILLLDASSSMRDRMGTVHEAAKSFMKMLRPGDRGAIVAFADRVQVVQGLTSDAAAIEAAISSTQAQGATALNTALYVALKEFGRPAAGDGDVRRQAIAVLSDGEDTASLVSFEDVVGLARKTGVNVYTIGLQSDYVSREPRPPVKRSFSNAEYSLRMLAKETGAQAFFPSGVHQLRGVYASIAEELESQYSIAYAPTNRRIDNRFRRILVRVTADPAFKPRARTGYTSESN